MLGYNISTFGNEQLKTSSFFFYYFVFFVSDRANVFFRNIYEFINVVVCKIEWKFEFDFNNIKLIQRQ